MRKLGQPWRTWRGPIFWARTVQTALLCVVAIAMLGAGQSRFDRLGHELMCSCGCSQILLESRQLPRLAGNDSRVARAACDRQE
jgi:hypothetical protein